MAARHVLCGALLFVFASANELISSLPIVNCYGGAPGAYTNGAISLTVEQTVWNVDGQVKFTTRGYSYNGQSLMPGPIIRVMPGTTCAVTVTNALPTASQAQCTRDMSEWVPGTPGSWMCPDVTTFYVQGGPRSSENRVLLRQSSQLCARSQDCTCRPIKTLHLWIFLLETQRRTRTPSRGTT